jgi:hypothetical protein
MGDALEKYDQAYTISDWEKWNDPWELIHGFPYAMSPAPTYRHQDLNTRILIELSKELGTCKKCRAIMPIDWVIDDETVVEPDILILCKPVEGNRLTFPPSAIFEILSPSTKRKDKGVKFGLYQEQKVPYYILVDPDDNTFVAWSLDSSGLYQPMESAGNLEFTVSDCKISIDLAAILSE